MGETFLWLITILLLVTGMAGTLLPMVPGLPLVFLGIALHKVPFLTPQTVSWTALIVTALLMVAAEAADKVAGFVGAKKGGVGWPGIGCAVAGLFVGVLFAPIGFLIGPVLGIFAAQHWIEKQPPQEAWKATLGYLLGLLAGSVVKFGIGLLMIAIFVWSKITA